jgi:ATP-binding cassette subfamily C protein
MTEAGQPRVATEAVPATSASVTLGVPAEAGMLGGASLASFFRSFYDYARPTAPKAGLFLILGAAADGVGLLLLVPLLSIVLGSTSGSEWLDRLMQSLTSHMSAESQLERLALVLSLFAIVIVARGFIIRSRDVLLARLQVGFVEKQRLTIIQLLTRSRWEMITRLRHGRIMHVLGGDLEACGDAASLLVHALVAFTLVAGQVLLMFLLSPRLALLILVLLAIGALATRPLLKRAQRLGHSLTSANLELVTGTNQFLGGLKLALSQDLQLGFLNGFQLTLSAAAARRVAFVRQRSEAQILVTTAGAILASLVIIAGIGVFGAAPATLLAFLFILSRMIMPLNQLQTGMQQVFHSLPAYGKVEELQEELRGWQSSATPLDVHPHQLPAAPIRFEEVSFSHNSSAVGDRQGIYDLTLTIDHGSFIGLVGPSGAGKTTFCDLLVGLYPPRRGTIKIGSLTLGGASVSTWRASLSYVSQDPFLFHDTIRANLLWARPAASEDQLWRALSLAGAEDLVRMLPDDLETIVGERGGLLSGGERQRLALARALLREPKLLVLDEATNAIDVLGERALLQRLSRMPDRPTIVMVAHRETSLQFCDRLLELRDGRLAADRKNK